MGNLCSKKKGSPDNVSLRSDGSRRKESGEGIENHSLGSKRPSQQNGTGAPADVADPLQSSVRSRIIRDTEPSSVSGDSVSSPTVASSQCQIGFGSRFSLPLEMDKQSESVKNLFTGHLSKLKPGTKRRKVTLYVSAADSQDFRLEKGKFHEEVYPELRNYALSRGYELHITDLHCKTESETKQDHEFADLCLSELKRQLEVSYVVPIVFLNNSLGAPLLPRTIEQQDFESAVKGSGNRNLFEKWYALDSQAQPPCYTLKPIAAHFPGIHSEKEEERALAVNGWRETLEEIFALIVQTFPTELRDAYITTVIEQEIHNSIFMSREVARRSLWICRKFTHITSENQESNPIETECARRVESVQKELRNQLLGNHMLRLLVKWHEGGLNNSNSDHSAYLKELSTQLQTLLKNIIDEIIEEDSSKAVWKSFYGIDGGLSSEVNQHAIFCQQAAKYAIPIEHAFSAIKGYLGGDASHPLVIHGEKGSGKSSFLSRVCLQVSQWFPDALLLFRFVGLSPESRTLDQIMRTLAAQMAFLLTGRNEYIPHNCPSYWGEMKRIYSSIKEPPFLIILIDGLDELSSVEGETWSWASEELPGKMKLIVSAAEEAPVFHAIKSNLAQPTAFISMTPLGLEAAESLLAASILQYSGSVDQEVEERLTTALASSTLPLYIKVLAWEATIDNRPEGEAKNLSSAINRLFASLEKSIGKERVGLVVRLLAVSRSGLCDSELLDILAHSSLFSSNTTFLDWAPASIFLAQLYQKLGPFLDWGLAGEGVVIRFRDSAFLDVVRQRYFTGKEEEKSRQLIIDYFQGNLKGKKARSLKITEEIGNRFIRRKVEEIPYQRLFLKGTIKEKHLLNIDWLLLKIQNSSVFNVLEDIRLEETKGKGKTNDLYLLAKTLELSATALSYDGRQLFGQMYGRLQPYFTSREGGGNESELQEGGKCPFMKKLFETSSKPPVPSFLPLSPFNMSEDLEERSQIHFDEIVRMKEGNQFVITYSTAEEIVRVWDMYRQVPIRTLKGVKNPNSLRVIDDKLVVILCGRELSIFNLDDGTFVTKMKGVMNQKMPYYGLHDSAHIVSISRNRMYVNLMNIETGDCVTTFKVGEDRFLNSLIVSENGKMLVCGDETQKPFPLLVWDLTSRKLLYDLRIPHHEFLTNYSAITKEGHFACCVCREVDDPGPNFIVVYDLQSGTLFKKWKPGFNTQAIQISSQGSCVITGLEDNRILIWDLVTGACQWSLEKHTAPVNILRLDQKGSRCISADSTGRDRTVCLWNISDGTLLALFTPDAPFTACEVTNNGDGVILGLKGRKEILTLLYRHNETTSSGRIEETFGTAGNEGKISELA